MDPASPSIFFHQLTMEPSPLDKKLKLKRLAH
jgi:hypothetical protein